MPDQSEAATEHALLQELTEPLATLPDDPVTVAADADFPIVLRGYDRLAVDAYVRKTSQLVAELQATRSPDAAIRRALERVGEQISGILQRAHDTAAEITTQSRREAEDRLEVARQEAAEIKAEAESRLRELDRDTDRIWIERDRIVEDARGLAQELLSIAEAAGQRFPPAVQPSDEDSEPAQFHDFGDEPEPELGTDPEATEVLPPTPAVPPPAPGEPPAMAPGPPPAPGEPPAMAPARPPALPEPPSGPLTGPAGGPPAPESAQ